MKKLFILSLILSLLPQLVKAQIQIDRVRLEGDDPKARFQAIYDAQVAAVEADSYVDYSPFSKQTIYLEIPENPQTIPLAKKNDFFDIVLVVLNEQKNYTLFGRSNKTIPLEIETEIIDAGDYRNVEELSSGEKLLVVTDNNNWIAERKGYGYSVKRNDLIQINNGYGNKPVTLYTTPATDMKCSYVNIDGDTLRMSRLHVRRHPSSTFRTGVVGFGNLCHVRLEKITVATPQYHKFNSSATSALQTLCPHDSSGITSRTKSRIKLEHDGVISISNCADIELKDVVIDGTHTIPGSYGYALSIGNTYNARFDHVVADANWGVFGSNFMHQTTLSNCDLNRFDIHCYGRDVECNDCTFRKKQTQFSSFYGMVRFNRCVFDDCVPVRVRGDYNAHTPFEVEFNDCSFMTTLTHHHLVNVILYDTTHNARPELHDKYFPSVRVKGMKVEMPRTVRSLDVYHPTGATELCGQAGAIKVLDNVKIEGLQVVTPSNRMLTPQIRISTTPLTTMDTTGRVGQGADVNSQRINKRGKKGREIKVRNLIGIVR